MSFRQTLRLLAFLLPVGLTACGGDSQTGTTPSTTTGTTTLEQPAIWPAASVRFATPEQAAEDFVTKVLAVPINLGPFQAGDARSGEIELRFAGEGGTGHGIVRSVLLLRQLGPESSWFVLGAANENASINIPAGSTVPAATTAVTGKARGFEGAVTVTALAAGDAERVLDEALTTAGSMETPEPFSVRLDLSQGRPGETIVLLVRGGVGLESDPGEVGAIPVVIGGQ